MGAFEIAKLFASIEARPLGIRFLMGALRDQCFYNKSPSESLC